MPMNHGPGGAEDPRDELEGFDRIEPFDDFTAAARAVLGKLASTEPTPTPELLMRLLGTLLATEAKASMEGRRADRAEADSLVDPLTGLGNRRAWLRLLNAEEERCRRHGVQTNVIVVDLDALKEVNDTKGHAAGDDMLRRAARSITANVRNHDVVARLGGDEFGVLATHCSRADADLLAMRIKETLEAEDIPASVGVAARDPSHGLQRSWEEADAAMYEAKRTQRNSDAWIQSHGTEGLESLEDLEA